MRTARGRFFTATLVTGLSLGAGIPAMAESKHVFGIAFWDWGANVDIMAHRTGWVVEANGTQGNAQPNVGGRYEPATAQGFTILQRLDYSFEQTIPLDGPTQDIFANQCGNWANKIKKFCRHYSIGNEVEFFGVTPQIYAACFTKVRNAIKAVQPEAIVAIGHMINGENVRATIRLLGPDGYDGLTDHTGSSAPTGMCDMLDQENARPGVGVYVTEWGWVAGTNPNSKNVMRAFYNEIGRSNASRARQIYCAAWYLYPDFLGRTFSLETSPLDNEAFEAAVALGTSVNSFAANPVLRSDFYADIPDSGLSIEVNWKTNVPARRQLWWVRAGTFGAGYESFTPLMSGLQTTHALSMTNLTASTTYEVVATSTANDHADASARRFRVKSGPWMTQAPQVNPGQVVIQWFTDWPASTRVEFGKGSLDQVREIPGLVTNHVVSLTGLPRGTYAYRVLSAENNPDGEAPLVMRSPVRSFTVIGLIGPDLDDDGDVDHEDFGRFQACYSGSGVPQNNVNCIIARLDGDEDVDLDDFAIFQACYSGPGIAANPQCDKN